MILACVYVVAYGNYGDVPLMNHTRALGHISEELCKALFQNGLLINNHIIDYYAYSTILDDQIYL